MSPKSKKQKFNGFHRAVEVWHSEMKHVWPIYLINEIEADRLELLRKTYKDRGLKAPSYNALVIKAVAKAIDEQRKTFPEINAYFWRFLFWKKFVVYERISCGVVVAIDMEEQDRIAVGVVEDPEKKSLVEITESIQNYSKPASLAMKNITLFYKVPKVLQMLFNWIGAHSTKIRFENRGTFNITSIGKFGVDIQTAPQSASLQFGFGVVRDRVVVREGKPFVTPTFYLTCSFDRRIMNGRSASIVLARAREILQAADFGET